MRVTRLDIGDLRRFDAGQRSRPVPALNLLTGANGAGKTSVLEALHLMAYGRSFRGRVRRRPGPRRARRRSRSSSSGRGGAAGSAAPGLRHAGRRWEGRLDGAPVAQLGELCAALAVVTFEPGSHDLIDGRRRARGAASSTGACSTWNRSSCRCGGATRGR